MPSYPPFVPRRPWWGPDLQTVRNTLLPPRVSLAPVVKRLELPADDGSGDVLLGALHPGKRQLPLVLLIHGLGGCEESVYMRRSADFFSGAGYAVLRLNLRGAGPSRSRCAGRYHAGASDDVAAAVRALPPELLSRGILALGFSLGGNVLLKLLGEGGHGLPLRAAVSVSAPLDLAQSCARLQAPRNFVYHRYMLSRLRHEALAAGSALSERERAVVRSARSLYDFDDRFVAPRGGFAGADDYYARCSARAFLAKIAVPALLIHALDDPWIPADVYRDVDWSQNQRLEPLLPRGGGHVGFHARDHEAAWHDRCAERFFARVSGIRDAGSNRRDGSARSR